MLCIVKAKAGAFRYPAALLPGVIEQLLHFCAKNGGRGLIVLTSVQGV